MKSNSTYLALFAAGLVVATYTDAAELQWRSPNLAAPAPTVRRGLTTLPSPNLVPVPQSSEPVRQPATTALSSRPAMQQSPHYNPLAPMPLNTPQSTIQPTSHQQTLPPLAQLPLAQPSTSQPPTRQNTPVQQAPNLPNSAGQFWRTYDLRPYTRQANVPGTEPQQEIIDWIMRETGTETWFAEPFGALSADRDSLRVYHTPAVQNVAADIVNRFMRAAQTQTTFDGRLVTLASPNWRADALPVLRPVPVQTDGVEAWLVSKENAAVVLSQLRARSGYREHHSPELMIRNGETRVIDRTRPLTYSAAGQQMRQIAAGLKMKISPLLAIDGSTVDAVVKIETSQLEKLSRVQLATPAGGQSAELQVPQTSSWRLHERFRWPTNEVLIISCGLAASPDLKAQPPGLLKVFRNSPPRSETLLFLEARENTPTSTPESPSARISSTSNRGRY